MVFRALVFTFLPTALELCLVCGILWTQFSALVAGAPSLASPDAKPLVPHCLGIHLTVAPYVPVSALVVATFVGYTAWTASLTQQATDARKNLNAMDDLTSGKAIDALLNFETVNLFNNAPIEVRGASTGAR